MPHGSLPLADKQRFLDRWIMWSSLATWKDKWPAARPSPALLYFYCARLFSWVEAAWPQLGAWGRDFSRLVMPVVDPRLLRPPQWRTDFPRHLPRTRCRPPQQLGEEGADQRRRDPRIFFPDRQPLPWQEP